MLEDPAQQEERRLGSAFGRFPDVLGASRRGSPGSGHTRVGEPAVSLVIHQGCDCLWDFHIQSLPEFVCLFWQESSSSYSSEASRPPAALCLNCLDRPQVTARILDFGLGHSGPFSCFLMNKLNPRVTSGSPKAGASSRAFLRVRKASCCCCPHSDGSFSALCSFTEGPTSE